MPGVLNLYKNYCDDFGYIDLLLCDHVQSLGDNGKFYGKFSFHFFNILILLSSRLSGKEIFILDLRPGMSVTHN